MELIYCLCLCFTFYQFVEGNDVAIKKHSEIPLLKEARMLSLSFIKIIL